MWRERTRPATKLANRIDQYLSSQGDGTGTLDQAAIGIAIAGATNATPIVLETATHGRAVDDYVYVDGVLGNTAANGFWKVSAVPDSTHLTLEGSVGNGAYSADIGDFVYPSFVFKPAITEIADLERFLLHTIDSKNIGGGYMNVAALTNGFLLKVLDSDHAVVHDFTPTAITSFGHWSLLAGVDAQGLSSDGNVAAAVRFTFNKGTGESLRVDGRLGHFLVLMQRDDLSGLVEHHVSIQGHNL